MAKRFSISNLGFQISSRKFLSVMFLISGTLAWFFLIEMYFIEIFSSYSSDTSLVYLGLLLFYGVGALSAIIGSSISERVDRRQLLIFWIFFGVVVTALLTLFQGQAFLLIFSVLLGISFGLGFPSCAALLADATVVEERAKVSGLVILATFFLTFAGMIIIPLLNLGLMAILLLFSALRAVSLTGLVLDRCERKSGKTSSWYSVFTYKRLASFVVPWILFNAAAGLLGWWDIPKTPEFQYVTEIGVPLAYVSIAFFGLIAGVLADHFGRRQPIIISLVMLGVSFGLLSFYLTPLTMLIYYVTYGIAWGFLFTLYLAVPGDLSYSGSREKFYALGTMMPLIVYMGLSAAPQFLLISVSASFLSPILSIILFLSVIPVFRATETLPESAVRKRKLDEHVKKLGELLEEEQKNN
jgi:MFS family permease